MLLDFSKFTTKIATNFKGKLIGKDEFGNKYYESKKLNIQGRKRRWVVYSGLVEPTKIPPIWFAWSHYMTDEPLEDETKDWYKPHLPNTTGTVHAYEYKPQDDTNYQAWKPE